VIEMSPADLAMLSLLDPDQGVCPNGHSCRQDEVLGYRTCSSCGYRGLALICWEVTAREINAADRAGAAPQVVDAARTFLAGRNP
jgi:hypothetical protein